MPGPTRREFVSFLDRDRRIISLTAAVTLTHQAHEGRILFLSLLAGFTVTLPAAQATGAVYRFHVGVVNTSNSYIINATPTTDNFEGSVTLIDTDSVDNSATGFVTTGSDDNRFTMNGTTTGGLTIGDWIEFLDAADTVWHVRGQLSGSGTIATPFSSV